MTVDKLIGFKSPWIPKTFQDLVKRVVGSDGYLGGAEASDNGVLITLQPYQFVQRGIIVSEDAVTTVPVPSPAGLQPWFVIASVFDDDHASGIQLTATRDLALLATGPVVIAYKTNGIWKNPVPLTNLSGTDQSVEPGLVVGGKGFPTLTGVNLDFINLDKALVVDPAGARRELADPTQPARMFRVAKHATFKDANRNDYAVLRQREGATAEIVDCLGNVGGMDQFPTVTPTTLSVVVSGAGHSCHAIRSAPLGATNGDTFSWGEGTNLKFRSAGAGVVTVLVAAATVSYTVLVGRRASDGVFLIVYTDGDDVRVVSYDETLTAVVDGPVTIDTQANACINLDAVMGPDEVIHVVYQHDEGGAPPNQQIYYARVSTAIATFGTTVAATPRLVNIVNSTRNDTFPSIAQDRQRNLHIAYATGVAANTFGDLRYAVIDKNGTNVSTTSYNTYGFQADPYDRAGIVLRAHDHVKQPKVAVTPHDEVYIVGLARDTALVQYFPVLFGPDFKDRLGFAMIQLRGIVTTPEPVAADVISTHALVADELGQLHLGVSYSGGPIGSALRRTRIQTPFAPFGVIGDSYNEPSDVDLIAANASSLDICMGPTGGLLVFFKDSATSFTRFADTYAKLHGRAFMPHPRDVVLAAWLVEGTDPPTSTIDEKKWSVFNTRPKRMNYPFLVGDEGDFQGFDSLHEACDAAGVRGSSVIVRSGEYLSYRTLRIGSGVSVRCEGQAILHHGDSLPTQAFVHIGQPSMAVTGTAAQVVTVASTRGIHGGDLVRMATSGLHRVRRILDGSRFLVDGAAPVGATVIVYAMGVTFENIFLRAGGGAFEALLLENCTGALIKNVTLFGSAYTGDAVGMRGCLESVLDHVDVSDIVTAGGASAGIRCYRGDKNILLGCVFDPTTGGAGAILRAPSGADEDTELTLIDCLGPEGAGDVYVISAARTTPVHMTNTRGTVNGITQIETRAGHLLPMTTGLAVGSAAAGYQWDGHFEVMTIYGSLDPDADDSVDIGALKRFLKIRSNQLLLENQDGGEVSLHLKALITQETTIFQPEGVGDVVNVSMPPHGGLIWRGAHFFDEFNTFAPGVGDGDTWETATSGPGSVDYTPGFGVAHAIRLRTGVGPVTGSAQVSPTGTRASYVRNDYPQFRARLAISPVAATGTTFTTFGFANRLFFRYNSTAGTITISHTDSAATLFSDFVDTTFAPTAGDFFYVFLGVISTSQYLWRVSLHEDWTSSDLVNVETASGTGFLITGVFYTPFFRTDRAAPALVNTDLEVDVVETWANGRNP